MEQSKITASKLAGTGLPMPEVSPVEPTGKPSYRPSGSFTPVALPTEQTGTVIRVKNPGEIACPNMLAFAQPGKRPIGCLNHGCAAFVESVIPHPDDPGKQIRVWRCGMLPTENWNIFA